MSKCPKYARHIWTPEPRTLLHWNLPRGHSCFFERCEGEWPEGEHIMPRWCAFCGKRSKRVFVR